MDFLMALPIQTTIIIESGNGILAYWLFKEIFYIGHESDRNYIEKIVKGWESFVKDKAFRERRWKFDSVSDLPRMLRAVGTVNHIYGVHFKVASEFFNFSAQFQFAYTLSSFPYKKVISLSFGFEKSGISPCKRLLSPSGFFVIWEKNMYYAVMKLDSGSLR